MAFRRLRRFGSAPTELWSRVIYSRSLKMWVPPRPPEPLPASLEREVPALPAKLVICVCLAVQVTKVTRGVGFNVLYSEAGESLWFCGEDPPISGGRQGELEEVSLPGQLRVKQVAAGRRHVVAVTTTGEGNKLSLSLSHTLSLSLQCFQWG